MSETMTDTPAIIIVLATWALLLGSPFVALKLMRDRQPEPGATIGE